MRRMFLAVIETSQIVDAQRLFGDPDYLLHVVAADQIGRASCRERV